MSDLVIQILAASMLLATPLLLAAIGELVVEKSGVINLGVEGMMLIGGLAGFIALYQLQTSTCTMLIGDVCFTSENSANPSQYIGPLLVAAPRWRRRRRRTPSARSPAARRRRAASGTTGSSAGRGARRRTASPS